MILVMRARASRWSILSALLAVTAVLGLAAAGCGSGDPASDGPLSSADGRKGPIPDGAICVPGGRPQTFGDQTFTNYGTSTVVVDRVVLLHPHNERLIGSYAVLGGWLIGAVPWPPKSQDMPPQWRPGWNHRQPVRGFRLAPGKTFNMVLGVATITPARGTSRGMLVFYHDPSASYVAKNFFANNIASVSSHC